MLTRRTLLSSAGAAAAVAAMPAYADNFFNSPEPAAAEVQKALVLTAKLGDRTTANIIAAEATDIGLTWTPPTIAASKINSIVAYSFGNRPTPASGNTSSSGGAQAAFPDPGPLNELLADAVHAIYSLKAVPIYAQWEIQRFLVSKYGYSSSVVYSVEPIVNPTTGAITYLSTAGVAAAIVAKFGATALGTVGVVGHRDHVKRCVETSIAAGMINSFMTSDIALPLIYDPASGQPWTRTRALYLIHDMYAQAYNTAAAAQAAAYPNG